MAARLETWRSTAELVAAVAVVLSVIYLGLEIRTASQAISIERSSELYSSFDDLTDLIIADKELRTTLAQKRKETRIERSRRAADLDTWLLL